MITSILLSLSLSLCYETRKISDVCLINPSKSEIKDKKDIEVSFLLVEDLEICQLYAKTANSKKIQEVYQGYNYFAENDLLLPKIRPSFENRKMSPWPRRPARSQMLLLKVKCQSFQMLPASNWNSGFR